MYTEDTLESGSREQLAANDQENEERQRFIDGGVSASSATL